MDRLPQCFRCGEIGHVQLGCTKPFDPEVRKLVNQLSRAQRTAVQHADYLDRYNSRRQASQIYKGTTESLQPMIHQEIDYLLEVKNKMEAIPANDIGLIANSAIQVRALKDDMESNLAGIRELIYTSKKTRDPEDPNFEKKLHVEIFRCTTHDLEDLRNAIWRDLWKLDRHMDFAVKLLGEIRGLKERMEDVRRTYLDRKQLFENGITLEYYDGMKTVEKDALATLDRLYLFCPDQRIREEQQFFRRIVEAASGIGSAILYFISDPEITEEDLDPLFVKLANIRPPTGSPF